MSGLDLNYAAIGYKAHTVLSGAVQIPTVLYHPQVLKTRPSSRFNHVCSYYDQTCGGLGDGGRRRRRWSRRETCDGGLDVIVDVEHQRELRDDEDVLDPAVHTAELHLAAATEVVRVRRDEHAQRRRVDVLR